MEDAPMDSGVNVCALAGDPMARLRERTSPSRRRARRSYLSFQRQQTPPNQHTNLFSTHNFHHRRPRHPINPRNQLRAPTTDNAYSRVRDVQGGQAYSAPDLRRRRLRRQQSAQGRTGFRDQRAVGAEHDGAIGAGGAGQVLLQRGRQPLGEVRTLER
jgi:hypothetical protein